MKSSPASDAGKPTLPDVAPDIAEQEMASDIDNVVPTHAYNTLPILGLGGSAGSLAPMQTFFSKMPADSGMAFVVVVHLSAEHDSMLAEILQRSTPMKVIKVARLTKVEANHVYVIPPGHHLIMRDGHIDLTPIENPRGKRVPVDLFFRTLADTHGPHAAALVLSGGDGDGCIGIKRIKERGGLTIAQDPGEAEIPHMPRCSIATGMVDWIMPVAEIPRRLLEYRQNEGRVRLPPEEEPAQPEDAPPGETVLRDVLAFLCMRTGHDFTCYKRATILRRLARRMQVNNVTELPDYLAFLRTQPGEAAALLQDVLISVTNFFRDRDSFEALRQELPAIFAGKKAGDQVRVWVVACATGEEAYSMAMLLSEYAEQLESRPAIQIFATDIDENAIQTAREGRYPETIAADVSEERLRQFFTHEPGTYRIKREIREMVLFALHNVLKDSPFSRLDVLTCRNLLIYLNREAQTRVFQIFNFALGQEGRLFLGSSESADEVRNLFTPVDKAHRVYKKTGGNRENLPLFTSSSFPAMHSRALGEGPVLPAAVQALTSRVPANQEDIRNFSWEALHFKLLQDFVPPSLIVNSAYDIIHLSEGCGRFLQFSGGKTSVNLLHLIDPTLRIELRAALFRATQAADFIQVRGVRLEIGNQRRAVDISVRPARELAPDFLLVVFEENQGHAPETASPEVPEGVVHHLEREIEHLKHQLRETAEQYEASSEELKASNEELQAMNEELRSATEELETGREELQSINEEITTVNQELKSKVHELSYTNSDLQNLMASTHIATIFLDRQLRIKRYTPSAAPLFNLITTDVGRPLSDLRHRLNYDGLAQDADSVLQQLTPVGKEISDRDGRWFLTRMMPYRTTEDQIAGIVLTFVDITETKQAQEALRDSEERLVTIFEQAAVGQSELTLDGGFVRVNDALCRMLGRTREELLNMTFAEVTHPEDLPACLQVWGKLLETGVSVSTDKRYLRPDGTVVPASSSLSRLGDGAARPFSVLAVTVDMSQRVEAAEALEMSRREILNALHETRQARAAAEHADQIKNNFLAVLSHELRTPLTPVLMGVQSMAEEPDLSEELRDLLEMIERNVLLETYLIDDLLDITRITRGKMDISVQPMDLHHAVKEALHICESELSGKHQRLDVHLDAPLHHVRGDKVRLQQVFWNLLKNACKFTPENGAISVRSYNQDGQVVVEIQDTGIGISPDNLPHIFNAFTQADPSIAREFGGLGLGLAISMATMNAHEGRLEARSAGKGQGSTFIVALPVQGR